jgi:hypothetical protein
MENPNDAPAKAYVPMPDGASSDAPVINPGPRILRNLLIELGSRATAASSEFDGGAV